jgi:hypothetical protein
VNRLAIALTLAATSCATTWVKPGASEQDFMRDRGACQAQAHSISNPQVYQTMMVYEGCMQGKGWQRSR